MDRYKPVDNANADKRSIYDNGKYRNPEWVSDKLNTLERELAAANAKIEKAKKLVASQAEDEGLWFVSVYITEAYLQSALRALAAVIEED